MHRLLNFRILIVIAVTIASIFAFSALIRSCSDEQDIRAKVSHVALNCNEPLAFADSTKHAQKWLWEFGNGDKTSSQSGEYRYTQPGKYQIRLTVNDKYQRYFLVEVRKPKSEEEIANLIRINAPESAMQNELIVFKAEGESEQWRWEFGETGMIDSRDKKTLYAYSEPGIYNILLSTEKTKYPIQQQIEILPQYHPNDTTDVVSLIGNEIKENLQAIVDGQSFNKHYNKILNKFLCENAHTPVVINNNKYNDFYSYCQGLKIIGRSHLTMIENVLVDLDETNSCIKKLTVIQYDTKEQQL